MPEVELIATSAFGLESIVADELRELGYKDMKPAMGGVSFRAELGDIPRLNLWLRCSDRVLVKIGEFQALTFDELFEKTKALPWSDWLPSDAEFPVEGRSVLSQLFSVSDCQAIVKKAIVEKMKAKYKKQWFPESGGRYRIEVSLLKDTATLTLDTTGPGLHKRGYRKLVGAAPLKETLAASMIRLARWHADKPLIDPLCGTGTIAIEAALMAKNIAPGLCRTFSSESWPLLGSEMWDDAREDAEGAIRSGDRLEIYASDIDPDVLSLARKGAHDARVESHINFECSPVKNLTSDLQYGCIICNPPYGERLGDARSAEGVYRDMKTSFTRLGTWSYYVLTSYPRFEKVFGLYADKKRKVFNGQIECVFYQFYGPKPPRK